MIISMAAAKAFDKVPHPFMLKVMKKRQIEVLCFIMKTAYVKLIANIIRNGGNRTFSLKSLSPTCAL